MRKLLLACTALAFLPLLGQAQATPITITVSADGGAATTFSGNNTVSVASQTFGAFNVNSFNVFSFPDSLSLPSILDSNTLDANTTLSDGINHTLAVDVVGLYTGITPGTYKLTSSFDTTGLAVGWNIKEVTDINGVNLAPGFNFTSVTGTQAGALDQVDTVTVGSTFTASEHFLLTTNGSEGQANNGIEMAVTGAPGPTMGSGLPGAFAAMLIGGIMWWRRRLTFSLMP